VTPLFVGALAPTAWLDVKRAVTHSLFRSGSAAVFCVGCIHILIAADWMLTRLLLIIHERCASCGAENGFPVQGCTYRPRAEISAGHRPLSTREKETKMPSITSGPLDDIALLNIAIEIQRIVEEREGVQENAGRHIEYAFHAALLMVDAATRHLPDTQRIESFRTAVAMFADIAETDYIPYIGQPPVAQRRN
jgi:hypothetical protein